MAAREGASVPSEFEPSRTAAVLPTATGAETASPRPSAARPPLLVAEIVPVVIPSSLPRAPAGGSVGPPDRIMTAPSPMASARGPSFADALPAPIPPPSAPTGEQVAALPAVEPSGLRGLETTRVKELLGEPGLLRRDPPAEVWQYHGLNCVVDLFLYEEGGSRRVTYVQVRPLGGNGARVSDTECLSRIVRSRRPTG